MELLGSSISQLPKYRTRLDPDDRSPENVYIFLYDCKSAKEILVLSHRYPEELLIPYEIAYNTFNNPLNSVDKLLGCRIEKRGGIYTVTI